MMDIRWIATAFVGLVCGCTSTLPVCQTLETNSDWQELESPPSFAYALGHGKINPDDTSSDAQGYIWYSASEGRTAACSPGGKNGCGEHIRYFTNGEKEGIEEIVVCSDGPY